MCGIAGYLAKASTPPNLIRLKKAVQALVHRGPDQEGIWSSDRAALGFRRLSIIDLPTGNQPMEHFSGRYRIVFNGEIYNFKELRLSLEKKGIPFKTQSDTEVLLNLYAEEGPECVHRLRGMFAFAILDCEKNSLFLVRDRFGKKPLVYTETASGFYFASEMGALFQLADCKRTIDTDALQAYLLLDYIPSPSTIWKEIQRLPAGCTLQVRDGSAESPRSYWKLSWSPNPSHRLEEATEKFRALLEESVKLRMISDVPLGSFLSGGIDSSIITAAMTQSASRVKTFCVRFEEERFNESSFASAIAHRLGTQHQEITLSGRSLDSLDGMISSLGEPFADQSLVPTSLISQFTRKQVTVALTGDGGDELFAGYKRYHHLARAASLQRWKLAGPWLAGSRALFSMEQIFNPSRRSLTWPRNATDRILNLEPVGQYLELTCTRTEKDLGLFWKGSPSSRSPLDFIRVLDQNNAALPEPTRWQALDAESWLTDDILRKVDTASMAHSLECRSPFLDHHLAEWSASLPAHFNWKNGRGKMLLRTLYPQLIPPSYFERKKKGFSIPLGKWMRSDWKARLQESISTPSPVLDGLLDRKALSRIWEEHLQRKNDHSRQLWNWYVLWKWDQSFKPDRGS